MRKVTDWEGKKELSSRQLAPSLMYRVGEKMAQFVLNTLTLSNINRFSKFLHCQNQEKICNNIITKNPTTPQVYRYITLWNVSVLKATIENKTTSVTTHFKTVTTGNNLFVVSVIVYSSLFTVPCDIKAIHRWKVHLVGYNSVTDYTGLSLFA